MSVVRDAVELTEARKYRGKADPEKAERYYKAAEEAYKDGVALIKKVEGGGGSHSELEMIRGLSIKVGDYIGKAKKYGYDPKKIAVIEGDGSIVGPRAGAAKALLNRYHYLAARMFPIGETRSRPEVSIVKEMRIMAGIDPLPRLMPEAKSAIKAVSINRYRASASQKRQYGGAVVTVFSISKEGFPTLEIEGLGKTAPERKAMAIAKAEKRWEATASVAYQLDAKKAIRLLDKYYEAFRQYSSSVTMSHKAGDYAAQKVGLQDEDDVKMILFLMHKEPRMPRPQPGWEGRVDKALAKF